jgi:hypothetical protein
VHHAYAYAPTPIHWKLQPLAFHASPCLRRVPRSDPRLFIHLSLARRGQIGANALVGDERWGGAYGIEADFWADGDCKVVHVPISEIKVHRRASIRRHCAPNCSILSLRAHTASLNKFPCSFDKFPKGRFPSYQIRSSTVAQLCLRTCLQLASSETELFSGRTGYGYYGRGVAQSGGIAPA